MMLLLLILLFSTVTGDDSFQPSIASTIELDDKIVSGTSLLEYLYMPGLCVKFHSLIDNATLTLTKITAPEGTDWSRYIYYDNANCSSASQNLYDTDNIITSKSGFLIICALEHIKGALAFGTIQPVSYNTCQGKNIFYGDNKIFSVSSTSDGSCEMIILGIQGGYFVKTWIESINTNASHLIIKSRHNNRILLELQADDVKNWKNFGIFTQSLSITIPPSSSLTVHMSEANLGGINCSPGYTDTGDGYDTIQYQGGIQKGIMVSPSYTGGFQSINVQWKLYSINLTTPVWMTIFVKERGDDGFLTYAIDSQEKTELSQNQTITFKFSQFGIWFTQSDISPTGFLIEYLITDNFDFDTTTPSNEKDVTSTSVSTETLSTTLRNDLTTSMGNNSCRAMFNLKNFVSVLCAIKTIMIIKYMM